MVLTSHGVPIPNRHPTLLAGNKSRQVVLNTIIVFPLNVPAPVTPELHLQLLPVPLPLNQFDQNVVELSPANTIP